MDKPLKPHRRRNLLTGDFVLVSPQRATRPWSGQQEETAPREKKPFDPSCYLCSGNTRVSGHKNPDYKGPYVFENDTPAMLKEEAPGQEDSSQSLFKWEPVKGTCRVICYNEDHSLTMADMSTPQIEQVVDTWQHELSTLGKDYNWVQIFENKGAMMGCSNPHPHGQIWASSHIPGEGAKELKQQTAYFEEKGSPLLVDYIKEELEAKERIIVETDHWVAVVPFWAAWPFESLLAPKSHTPHLGMLEEAGKKDLANILRILTNTYDKLFQVSFPYSFGWHNAPTDGTADQCWQLHGHFYPPLLRSATVRKHMVGYEMLGEPGRDITPEMAAERLRSIVTNN